MHSVPALPDGSYSLSVWTRSSAAGASLYAKDPAGTMMTIAIPPGDSWTEVSSRLVVSLSAGLAAHGAQTARVTLGLLPPGPGSAQPRSWARLMLQRGT